MQVAEWVVGPYAEYVSEKGNLKSSRYTGKTWSLIHLRFDSSLGLLILDDW